MKHALALMLALCLFLMAGCVHRVPAPAPPAVPAASSGPSWDQTTYEGLIAAQAVLKGLREDVSAFPALKPQLNAAIAAYNVAQRAFKVYATSARSPYDQAAIEQHMVALSAKIVALQLAISAGEGVPR